MASAIFHSRIPIPLLREVLTLLARVTVTVDLLHVVGVIVFKFDLVPITNQFRSFRDMLFPTYFDHVIQCFRSCKIWSHPRPYPQCRSFPFAH